MKVAIYSRGLEVSQQKDIQLLLDELDKEEIVPVVYQSLLDEIREFATLPSSTQTFTSSQDLASDVDFLVSLGGDGTLLDTVTLVRNKNIPILGINFGRLGFLASLGREEVSAAVKALSRRSFVIVKSSLIHVDANMSLFGVVLYAL